MRTAKQDIGLIHERLRAAQIDYEVRYAKKEGSKLAVRGRYKEIRTMPKTLGLAHVNLNVSDIDRSVRFYREVFGLEILSDGTETIQKDGQPVELRQALLSTPGRQDLLALSHAASFPVGRGGLNHIGFNFESDEDVRVAIQAVPHHGGKVVKEGEREEGGVREVFAYVQDPDGYYVEMATQAIVLSASRAPQ